MFKQKLFFASLSWLKFQNLTFKLKQKTTIMQFNALERFSVFTQTRWIRGK